MVWLHVVEQIPALSGFDGKMLLRAGVVTCVPAGASVWAPGEASQGFSFALSGSVKFVVKDPRGGESVLAIAPPRSLLCGTAACLQMAYCCRAVAIERTHVLVVPREVVMPPIDSAVGRVVRAVAGHGAAGCRRLREALSRGARSRVCATLKGLANDSRTIVCADGRVKLPHLSRSTLAQMCALTTETVVRTLSDLRRRGIVEDVGGRLVVNVDLLTSRARDADSLPPSGSLP